MGNIVVNVYRDNYPYEQIVELLHESYEEHRKSGRDYLASRITVEQMKEYYNNKICIFAFDDHKIVGSLVIQIVDKTDLKKKWYEDNHFFYLSQFSVHPNYRQTNVAAKMILTLRKLEEYKKMDSIMLDTSREATELVEAYTKLFQIVDIVSWETTNYYSYVFRYALKGKQFSDRYVKFRFAITSFIYKIKIDNNGKRRFCVNCVFRE